MRFTPAAAAGNTLHALLTDYYREGEDAYTDQEELDTFIAYLMDLLEQRILWGEIAYDGDTPAGFVLFASDGDGYPFSECPGMGTIAEICVTPEYRRQGLGTKLVRHAEEQLRTACTQMYVCAHASAHSFWHICGYHPDGRIAANGLPICIKSV